MGFLFRWLMRVFVAMLMLAVLAAGLVYYLARQSLPDYDHSYVLDGPSGEIEIVRDLHAVPHILAKEDSDAFFGLGFVHAQDRLWQMTLLRRTAQGRLSEVFGEDTVEIDTLMRALDLYGLSREAVAEQSAATLAALEAYSAGVNAWLKVVQEQALGRGAPELFLFDARIQPWIPADSIAVLKLLALDLTDKAAREALRARLSLVLPEERLRDLMPEAPNPPVMGLPEFSQMFPGVAPQPVKLAARHPLDPVPRPGFGGGSNAFAAAGSRTGSGASLLATDPHLGLTAPSIWLLARMDLAEGPVMGATIPGIPAVLIGRNADLGWGLTSSYLDDQDIYIEKLNPEDPDQYLTPAGWQDFETRETVIAVRDAPSRTLRLERTRHGPVIPPPHFGAAEVTPPGHVASLAWTGLTAEDRSIGAGIALMRAHSIREARKAAEEIVAPSLNLTLADHDTVALQMAGAAPRRQAAHSSQGRIPAPGWLAVNDWQGFRPFSENPWIVNPPSGIVVNTNNRLTDAVFPDNLSFDWGDSYRIARASWLLGARDYHSLESFIEIQTDTVSEAARVLLPLIARDLWYSGEPAAEGTRERQRQIALERLAEWNGAMSEHAPEPLIYAAWVRALQRRLAIDELGGLVALVPVPDIVFLERVFRNTDGAGAWCDIVQSSETETCAEMARRALDDALIELEADFGPRLESWRWGDAHQALHRHQTLGSIPVLNLLANIRQSTPGGDNTLMQGGMPASGPEPYLEVHGAGFRAVYDFGDPDSSVFIIATGQSGHLLSRFYDDLAMLWRRSEYIPMSLDADLARAGAVGVTRITPAS
ncbi:MAG TPA: penicillin acylase family protein [Amaricoccus sp.]|uniref:penicillin acylase family protein n=1 Tax=Amaricoccus sp. TaxID=1872485 RepID=UPI002BDE2A6F|nr:penicillin acylase family protein [Amaricoccus sp.]HMQ91927.1 penicillin acylase family protein [Amaricoccus sp.]HMR51568.1 penicillin acylase family protein [Amaricoccus sp.]HMR59034.1 penicillin acylase family protein [Amaricoccus sp.]HMT98544.1 penicillin acylase family protein [Amaricoccus sp.]